MNRGLKGEQIFKNPSLKTTYLDMLKEESDKFKMKIFAYCIMDNHFHLVLENTTGRMSDFQKILNGRYGIYYRKCEGNSGYVFQGRFQSTLIENDSYLMRSIVYVLTNPVKAGIVDEYCDYRWSSAKEYFQPKNSSWLDVDFVNEIFCSKKELERQVAMSLNRDIDKHETKLGPIMGSKEFIREAKKRYNRRGKPDAVKRKRKEDRYLEPVEKVIFEFERNHGIKIEEIRTETHAGKRLRGDLLVLLKDLSGLRYREIAEFSLFSDIQYNSLGSLYKHTKKRMWKK